MPHKNLIFVFLILLSMTFGCRLANDWLKMKTDFFVVGVSQTAAQAVKKKVGTGSFKVQEVEITENTFKMKIEAPGNPQNIDEYDCLGSVAVGPQPVQRDAMTDAQSKIPFEEIDFSIVPQIIRKALDATQIEGGKVERMTLQAHDAQKFRWFVEIRGTRETASANADVAGNITSTNLSQTSRAANYKILYEAELNKAAVAIKSRFGENAQFTKLNIDAANRYLGIEVINSENPKTYDTYAFGIDGLKKSALPPITVSMINEPFSFDAINLTDAVNLVQKAKERLNMPNGQLYSVIIEKKPDITLIKQKADAPNNSRLIWTVWIKQGANQGRVNYDTKMNEISVQKD